MHYKRVMYLLEPSEASHRAAGHRVVVIESHDGAVTIEYKGQALPARAFVKDARILQGAIADNKVLSAVLDDVRRKQLERDAHNPKRMTLREEDLRLKSLGEAGLPVRRAVGRPTIRELALRRIAAETAVAAASGSPVDQLIAQTVTRLASSPPTEPAAKKRSHRPRVGVMKRAPTQAKLGRLLGGAEEQQTARSHPPCCTLTQWRYTHVSRDWRWRSHACSCRRVARGHRLFLPTNQRPRWGRSPKPRRATSRQHSRSSLSKSGIC